MVTLAKRYHPIILLSWLMLVGLPVHAEGITIRHSRGETVVRSVPAKVLTFDLGTLDILDRFGIPVAGVPTGQKPAYLSKYATDRVLKIGTLFEPDYEAIHAAAPDLVIIAGRSASKYGQLSKIAPTIDLTGDRTDILGDVRKNTEIIGQIFGKEQQATSEIQKLDVSVTALRQKAADAGKGLLILTSGGKMSAYGPGSRFGVLHDGFGIAAAAPNLQSGNHGQPISSEFILESNPDWLFVIDRDAAIGRQGQTARQVLDNELVRETTAWKKGQVVYLDPVNWYLVGGGLTALHQTVEQLSRAFDNVH